jgi:precorrin-2 dehydrogenase / sirohydrochlorin ferrochelatase
VTVTHYPIFLDLTGRLVVVVGGGLVAQGKIEGLLAAQARVRVIAPALTAELQQLARAGRVDYHARPYAAGDLAGADLVIGATNDRAVNAQVYQDATAAHIWVNVVDDPPYCTFITPSITRRGDLTVAVSTGGKAPVLAVRVREQIEALLGDEHAQFLELAGRLREPIAARHPRFEDRKQLWYQLVDSDVLAALKRGDEAAALRTIAEITGVRLAPSETGGGAGEAGAA